MVHGRALIPRQGGRQTVMSSEEYRYGEVIREHRLELGLTQRQVADQCGITDSALAHIEREVRLPSESVADGIAKALQLPAKVRAEFDAGLKAARERQARARVRNRAAVRPTLGSGGLDSEDIARDLAKDRELLDGYRYLKAALNNKKKPGLRKAVLCALKAWASEG